MADAGAEGVATILVVEDDADIRDLLVQALQEAGYSVESAANGAQALEWIHRRSRRTRTLIILDMLMPIMDGRGFLAALETERPPAEVGVLIFSASTLDIRPLLQLPLVRGALKKPCRTRDVLAAVATSWPDGAPGEDGPAA